MSFSNSIWMILNSRRAVRSIHHGPFFFYFWGRKISGLVVRSSVRDCFSEYFSSSLGHWPQVWKLQDVSSCSLFFGGLFHNSGIYLQAICSGIEDLSFYLREFSRVVNMYESIRISVFIFWKTVSSYFSFYLLQNCRRSHFYCFLHLVLMFPCAGWCWPRSLISPSFFIPYIYWKDQKNSKQEYYQEY